MNKDFVSQVGLYTFIHWINCFFITDSINNFTDIKVYYIFFLNRIQQHVWIIIDHRSLEFFMNTFEGILKVIFRYKKHLLSDLKLYETLIIVKIQSFLN